MVSEECLDPIVNMVTLRTPHRDGRCRKSRRRLQSIRYKRSDNKVCYRLEEVIENYCGGDTELCLLKCELIGEAEFSGSLCVDSAQN